MGKRCADNKLLCRWDKKENDLKFWFPRRCDGSFLNTHLCGERRDIPLFTKSVTDIKWIPSFVDELESRGYDITTLKFEVKLKEK